MQQQIIADVKELMFWCHKSLLKLQNLICYRFPIWIKVRSIFSATNHLKVWAFYSWLITRYTNIKIQVCTQEGNLKCSQLWIHQVIRIGVRLRPKCDRDQTLSKLASACVHHHVCIQIRPSNQVCITTCVSKLDSSNWVCIKMCVSKWDLLIQYVSPCVSKLDSSSRKGKCLTPLSLAAAKPQGGRVLWKEICQDKCPLYENSLDLLLPLLSLSPACSPLQCLTLDPEGPDSLSDSIMQSDHLLQETSEADQ